MSFLRTIRARLSGGSPRQEHALLFHVRCDRCGEVIRVRVDRRWDLLQELDDGLAGYSLHKDVLGTRCNQLIRMVVRFDRGYTITQQELHGGRFVTRAEYEAATAS